jgi:hypothetical protein
MHRTLLTFVALVAPAHAWGQEATPAVSPSASTSSIILAPKPPEAPGGPSSASPSPAAERPASPVIAAEISSGIAKYSPDQYGPNAPAPVSKDTDKPKNQIPRVPLEVMQKYVVHEARPPVFRTLDLYTKAGLIDLSFKEHPGLRIGNFFNLNANEAYERIVNEQLAAERQDVSDTAVAMAIMGDTEDAGAMQQALLDESRQSWWPAPPGQNLKIP